MGLTQIAAKLWTGTRGTEEKALRQIKILMHVSHPSVIRCYGLALIAGQYYLLLLDLAGPSLRTLLTTAGMYLSTPIALLFCLGLADALHHVHDKGIVHGDIKPDNILCSLTHPPKPVLIDFDCAKDTTGARQHATTTAGSGTFAYLAPEAFDTKTKKYKHTKESDIYSLGMTIAELCTGGIRPEYPDDHLAHHPIFPSSTMESPSAAPLLLKDPEFTQLVYHCLDDRRTQRPLVEDIVKSLEGLVKRYPHTSQEMQQLSQLILIPSSNGVACRSHRYTTAVTASGRGDPLTQQNPFSSNSNQQSASSSLLSGNHTESKMSAELLKLTRLELLTVLHSKQLDINPHILRYCQANHITGRSFGLAEFWKALRDQPPAQVQSWQITELQELCAALTTSVLEQCLYESPPQSVEQHRRSVAEGEVQQILKAIKDGNNGVSRASTEMIALADGRQLTLKQCYIDVIRYDKDHSTAYYCLGVILATAEVATLADGRQLTKKQCYIEAIRCDKDHSKAFYALGVALTSTEFATLADGRQLNKKQCYFDVIRLDRDHSNAYYSLGVALATTEVALLADGRQLTKIQCYSEAIRCDKDHSNAYYALGVALAATETITRADGQTLSKNRCYIEAIRCNKDHSKAYYSLGVALANTEVSLLADGRQLTKKQCYIEAILCDKDHSNAYYALGVVLALSDGQQLTKKQCFQLTKNHAKAYHSLGVVLAVTEVVILADGRQLTQNQCYAEAAKFQ